MTRVAIHGPDGYVRGTLQPSPLRVQRNSGLWNPRTSNFSEFYAEFTDPDADEGTATAGGNGDGETGGGGEEADTSGTTVFLQASLLALLPAIAVLLVLRRQ